MIREEQEKSALIAKVQRDTSFTYHSPLAAVTPTYPSGRSEQTTDSAGGSVGKRKDLKGFCHSYSYCGMDGHGSAGCHARMEAIFQKAYKWPPA